MEHLLRFGFQDAFRFNDDGYLVFKDSTDILSKVENVTIVVEDTTNIESIVEKLNRFENLKYLKIMPLFPFSSKNDDVAFPSNLNRLQALETINQWFVNGWKEDEVFE